MNPRAEPMLWLQLISLGVLPLEALLLLLLLGGQDPGPWPGLERLLCWMLGALAPALLLWQRPADVWSLLLHKTPLRGLLLLPLLWWIDNHAALAHPYSPLSASPRLLALLLSAAVLAVMLWQWQQLLQAIWLLSRPIDTLTMVPTMTNEAMAQQRLSLGLPLLLLAPFQGEVQARPDSPPLRTTQAATANKTVEEQASSIPGGDVADLPVAIPPEEPAANQNGEGLDQEIR
ncbi:MAG: low-complexity tail membrane protein [Cyanobacteria bacterium]|nr:low-complexity tail membrane protein [Cyanobacteriota bacterium]